jgi:hypothetical protein
MSHGAHQCPMGQASKHATQAMACACSMRSPASNVAVGPTEFRYTPSRAQVLPQLAATLFRSSYDFSVALAGHTRPLKHPPRNLV